MVAVPTSNTCTICGGVAGAIGGDRGGQRLGVLALVDGDDLVVLLAGVEVLGELVDPSPSLPRHRVPPLDLDLRVRRRREGGEGERANTRRATSTS